MPGKIYVFGHMNPDTDSICSAIAYCELKRFQGEENIEPYRLGSLNRETKFILDYFGVAEPEYLSDIKPTLRDLELYTPATLKKNQPIKEAWDYLKSYQRSRIIPIVDEGGKISGILSLSDITKLYMDTAEEDYLNHFEIIYQNMIDVLDVSESYGAYPYEKLMGRILIGSSINDPESLMPEDIVITSNIQMAKMYAQAGRCGCLMVTNGIALDEIQEKNCAVVGLSNTLFKTISLINQAISVGSIMEKDDLIYFSTDAEVDDVIHVVQSSPHRNFPVIANDGSIVGIISRRHLIEYNRKKVILVDHNERSQSVEGLDQAEIIEIIDHHRVADVQTDSPLYIRAEPVGSTATIVYKMYRESMAPVTREIAGILLSAILSDTLMFSSPTSTTEDKKAAEQLSRIAGVKLEEYGREMFAHSTSLEDYTPKEILATDRKRFIFGKYTTYISQVNTLDFRSIANMEKDLLSAMEAYIEKKQCDLYILMITDIVEGGSELLVKCRAKDLTCRAFGLNHQDDAIFLPGVVSRKKQVVPKLTIAVQS